MLNTERKPITGKRVQLMATCLCDAFYDDVAVATVNAVRALRGEAALPMAELIARGLLEYIDFPDALKGKYQCFTQADLTQLRRTGCDHRFADVATGIASYVTWLAGQPAV